MRVAPPPLPGDVPWAADYTYVCTSGHQVESDKPVPSCPLHIEGESCTGQLVRFGKGTGQGSHLKVEKALALAQGVRVG